MTNWSNSSRYPVWEERRHTATTRANDQRTAFQRDHARLVHSSAFRRLQSKTQVLGLGESDFYRTRLTHTMEVAQIGTAINETLKIYECENVRQALPPRALMNAMCLAHDIGHPPFGHGGEVALNRFMEAYGSPCDKGFEGNGQTLRVLSRLDKYSDEYGLNPTRRMILGILKYPAPYSQVVNRNSYPCLEESERWRFKADDWKPPKCFFDSEHDIFEWVIKPFSDKQKERLTQVDASSGKGGHGKTVNKFFDTTIMDVADDIAYGVHDLEDSISVGMVTRDDWESDLGVISQ